MCIIIDANVLSKFLSDPPDADAAPIHDWIKNKGGTIIFSTSGKFAAEVGRKARERLRVLVQRNVAQRVSAKNFQIDADFLKNLIKSDDEHILALARLTGARILYTANRNLMRDFTSKEIIDKPRGKIYSSWKNKTLLTKNTCK